VGETIDYRQPHACERCGIWIEKPNPRGKPQRFCSKKCRSDSGQMRTFTCQTCSKQWDAQSRDGQPPRYCCEQCRKDAAKARARTWYHTNPERVADQPSRQLTRRADYWVAWYAANSEAHRKQTALYQKANPEKQKAWNAARYARIRGSEEYEHFTLDEIYERDAGWCYLCQSPCDRSDASMEHVIPTCAPHHGPHTLANVKLAHRSCNGRKGRKLLSELPWYHPLP
jgi:5-methylcytosine-specific restriction endonuclease McrA